MPLPKSILMFLFMVMLGMASCTLERGYKNIGGRFTTDSEEQEDCRLQVFSHRDGGPLNGRYRLNWGNGMVDFAQFHDGRLNGYRLRYLKRRTYTSIQYVEGVPDGRYAHFPIQGTTTMSFIRNGRFDGPYETYTAGQGMQTARLRDGLKIGDEVYIENAIDTVFHLQYTHEILFPKPDLELPAELAQFHFEHAGKIQVRQLGPNYLSPEEIIWELAQQTEECRQSGLSVVVELPGEGQWMCYYLFGTVQYFAIEY